LWGKNILVKAAFEVVELTKQSAMEGNLVEMGPDPTQTEHTFELQ